MGGQSKRTKKPSKNYDVKLNHLHMHEGPPQPPLHPIFCTVSCSETFTPSIQPNLDLSHTSCPTYTPAINTLMAIWYSSSLSTCPNYLNTLLSAHSLTPFQFQLSYASLNSLLFHSWHAHQTSQTLHLVNIHFPSFSTSNTPFHCSIPCHWYNYSFIRTFLPIYPQHFKPHNNLNEQYKLGCIIHINYVIGAKMGT